MIEDRRRISPNQLVRIRPDYHDKYGGMWLVVREVDDEYLTGIILLAGEDQMIIRLPRIGVEATGRVYMQQPSD